MKRVSQADYKKFKESFLYWREKFGLTQYQIYFEHAKLNSAFANIVVDEQGKVATVKLCTENSGLDAKVFNPEKNGKHEAIHLLLHRLAWLGEQRYTASSEISDEEEAAVTRLEYVL